MGTQVQGVGQELTQTERERALNYLDETRNRVREAAKGLSESQLNFKPDPDSWSIAEVLEHLALLEEIFVRERIQRLEEGPEYTPERLPQEIDEMLVAQIPKRGARVPAPPLVTPTGRWSSEESLRSYAENRARVREFVKASSILRRRALSHPVFGPLDGYQWVLALAAHSERHTRQMEEAKTSPGYPKN